jgi:hypothetical protein
MADRRIAQPLIFVFAIATLSCIALRLPHLFISEAPFSFGSLDLIAYWAATQAFLDGLDPFQSATLYKYQVIAAPAMPMPQVFLNPPWSLPVFFPLLSFSFQASRASWLIANLLAYGISIRLSYKLFLANTDIRRDTMAITTIAALGYLPWLLLVSIGQVSALQLCFFLVGLTYLRKNWDVAAGAAFGLCAIKPHLFVVPAAMLALIAIKQRRYRLILSTLGCISILIVSTYLVQPNIFRYWLSTDSAVSTSYTSALLDNILPYTDWQYAEKPKWHGIALLAVGVIVLTFLYSKRLRCSSNQLDALIQYTPGMLAFSVALSPYFWLYDAILVLPLLVVALSHSSSKLSAVVFQSVPQLTGIFVLLFGFSMNSFWWFPWLSLVIHGRFENKSYGTPDLIVEG